MDYTFRIVILSFTNNIAIFLCRLGSPVELLECSLTLFGPPFHVAHWRGLVTKPFKMK